MADIGKKIEGAGPQDAKDKVFDEKKGKDTNKGKKGGVDKAEKAIKKRLK